MKSLKWSFSLILLVVACLSISSRAEAASSGGQWNNLLDVAYKFSWYPQDDLQKLLEVKTTEYGQDLKAYRDLLLAEVTGGRAPTDQVRTDDLIHGLPWRDYYHLSLAEFCLFLATDRPTHLQNAHAALWFLSHKTDQPEIAFWFYIYESHMAILDRDRATFIDKMHRLWQDVIIPYELEARNFSMESGQAGFVKSLPFLYENMAHLLIRKAILEQEIPALYALNVVFLDIQPKLTVENGYKAMAEQVVERMRGPGSDNMNINFAVALLEATAKRYDFEDEKDKAELEPKFKLTLKYYNLANSWADTGKGRMAIMSQSMGFMNYALRRFSDPADALASEPYFQTLPPIASNLLEIAFSTYSRLAAKDINSVDGLSEGFENRETYLQVMHQFLDSSAKLAIVLSNYYKVNLEPGQSSDVFAAVNYLKQYCNIFNHFAKSDADVIPDNAYFLAAYAASEIGAIYREYSDYSTDNLADYLAFAYQMHALEVFPLDLPGVLQMAFQCSHRNQVKAYFQNTAPLVARLRVSDAAAAWLKGGTNFSDLVSLMPEDVPNVIDEAFVLLGHFPEEQISENTLFTRAVAMANMAKEGNGLPPEELEKRLLEVGQGRIVEGLGSTSMIRNSEFQFFELKNELYASPESPVHGYLRALYNEVPFENHRYVTLFGRLN